MPLQSDKQSSRPSGIVSTDSADSAGSAGILHHKNGKVLLIKRSSTCTDYPGYWAFPGGHIEPGESPFEAASREVLEEVGHYSSSAIPLGRFDSFYAFHSEEVFDPIINEESSDSGWFEVTRLPTPMIPTCMGIIQRVYPQICELTELDVMRAIRDGIMPSPSKFGNVWLFAIRITGTGLAERHNEIAHKSESDYLTNEFLERCNGLPVVMQHPDKSLLDSQSFRDQVIGTCCLPYIDGSEVWSIAKIYDDASANLMLKHQLSTSPAVTVSMSARRSGDILIEGRPSFIDHVAICMNGVWDNGTPDGVRIDVKPEVLHMDKEDNELGAFMERLDSKLSTLVDGVAKIDTLAERISALEARSDAQTKCSQDATEEEKVKDDSKEDEKTNKVDSDDDDEEDESMKAKDDSTDHRIASLEAALTEFKASSNRSVEEREALAQAQSRADSVAMALGETGGVQPLMGENVFSYRKRIATKFAKYSSRFKSVDINSIKDSVLFSPVEDAIYADAMNYSKTPEIAAGTVRMLEARDEAGRLVRTASANSDPSAWMDQFAQGAVFHGTLRV